jgi:hypothetical protein
MLAGLADPDLRFVCRGTDLDREVGPDAPKQRHYLADIPQIDGHLTDSQGACVPGSNFRTALGGPFPGSTDRKVWLATGHTDMCKGFDGLALLVIPSF